MNWKEFFKPDWKKVLLTILIFVTLIGITIIVNIILPSDQSFFFSIFIIALPALPLFAFLDTENIFIIYLIEFIMLAIIVLFWYTISCIFKA